jgi:hypothetical protein
VTSGRARKNESAAEMKAADSRKNPRESGDHVALDPEFGALACADI